MIDDDLSLFIDPTEFASECVRSRPGEDDVPFAAIYGGVDEADNFGARFLSTQHSIRYATEDVDLWPEDTIAIAGPGAGSYKVDRAELVNDGRESVALLLQAL